MSVIWAKQTWGVRGGGPGKGSSKQASLGENRGTPTWVAYPAPSPFQTDLGSHACTPPLYPRGRVRRSQRGTEHVWRRECRCRTDVLGTPKHSRHVHQPVMGARGPGIEVADAPHSPKRSSTVHTSARRPPGAGEARSGALQERPARKSRACTYSRPSALAWATSSLSVGERSKASMISAAKTEERRSTSMAEAQARGTTPTADKAQPDGLQPRGEGTPATRGDLEAQREAQRSPPRAPGPVPIQSSQRRSAGAPPSKGPGSEGLSFFSPNLLKYSATFFWVLN